MKLNLRDKLRLAFLLILILVVGLCFYALKTESRVGLTVTFLNIGQGDAILIDSPTGNQLLIDGGAGRSILRELGRVMPFYDKKIDVILATHPDADHIGGLSDVFKKYKTSTFVESGVEADTNVYKELKKMIVAKATRGEIEIIEARKGMVFDLGGGALLEILFPDRDPTGLETNTASIVSRLTYGESEFLLTGDSPSSIEKYLVSLEDGLQGDFSLKSDVLKAGHHGSRTSTSEGFVKAVDPQYAVISAGLNNKYHHPQQEVLDILTDANIKILRTDLSGRIVFTSDGINLEVK